MENAIATSIQRPARKIELVTQEIKELCRQAQCMALAYIVEIGRRLAEAKSILPHGAWGDWLKQEVNFSQSTANNYMKLFEEYGDTQMTLFGAFTNSQSFGNLPCFLPEGHFPAISALSKHISFLRRRFSRYLSQFPRRPLCRRL